MKQLQNNFTTPEQSKRLLELGVPEDSADMYYHLANHGYYVRDKHFVRQKDFFDFYKNIFYPCWSVGRLAQIALICSGSSKVRIWFKNNDVDLIESFIDDICLLKESGNLDFSKLEE